MRPSHPEKRIHVSMFYTRYLCAVHWQHKVMVVHEKDFLIIKNLLITLFQVHGFFKLNKPNNHMFKHCIYHKINILTDRFVT